MVVEIIDLSTSTGLAGTYYLERSIGPLRYWGNDLIEFNGPVATQGYTWGGVKSLFR